MVLVADLVAPAAEAAAGQNVLGLQLGQQLLEDALTLQSGRGVALDELAVVGRHNGIGRLDHVGVDEALDTVLEQVLLIDGLQLRLRHLQHDGPVRAGLGLARRGLAAVGVVQSRQLDVGLRLVVGRVVGEDRGAVEGAVVLGKVQLGVLATRKDGLVKWTKKTV